MAKIHILESAVYNQIAAGEVIESTASVVKELVENAIDAKATHITVKIERGGKDFIQVVDNGCGIAKSDLNAAFLPHATSKIEVAKDLEHITTLGFRGEAVASIASVAKMEIASKYIEDISAYSLTCHGGQMGVLQPTALHCGSIVTVQNLFFNTPVRAKFLKTDKGEESEVTSCMTKFMLGSPNIAFIYQVDGKTKMQSYGGGLKEVLLDIYGKDILQNCIEVNATINNIHIYGYIGQPHFTKANRTYQTTFVNGRYVVNSTLQMAVHKAYESYLMKRQYPFYILYIDLPFEEVDVNVHPRKTDIRFSNNNLIFSSIYKVISSILDGTADAVNFIADDIFKRVKTNTTHTIALASDVEQKESRQKEQSILKSTYKEEQAVEQTVPQSQKLEDTKKDSFAILEKVNEKYKNLKQEEQISQMFATLAPKPTETVLTMHDSGYQRNAQGIEERFIATNTLLQATKECAVDAKQERIDIPMHAVKEQIEIGQNKLAKERIEQTIATMQKAKNVQQKIFVERAEYIGSIFQTYLLYSLDNVFYIIDQHAAHERLLFDKVCTKMKTRQIYSQSMLVPYIVQVNTEEGYFLEENNLILQELGFEISKFGEKTFKVDAVASDLADIDLKKFFEELFGGLGQFKGIQFVDIFREKLAMTACKAAVKGGQQLSQTEIDALFAMLAGDIGLKCPHGRPIAVRFSKTEIEKLFKRIV